MLLVSNDDSTPGVIAFGARPIGIIAIGGMPLGIVALGMAPSGLFSVGMFSRGLVSFGVAAFGVWTFGAGFSFGAVARGMGIIWGGVARGTGAGLGIDVEVLGTEGFLAIDPFPISDVVERTGPAAAYRGAQPGLKEPDRNDVVPVDARGWYRSLAWRTALFVVAIAVVNAAWSSVAVAIMELPASSSSDVDE